ncbi:MAG: N-6 DNA methylase [Deltaproteobacteria bacterium]|nr:N-6 DNA methylase [Deltaproteobacteria bacterium]
MIAEPLSRVLEATGYLSDGEPAASSVVVAGSGEALAHPHAPDRLPSFEPEAWWRNNANSAPWGSNASDLTVYFKYVDEPDQAPIADWQQEIWNRGFSPLLWIVSPDRVDLYNGFGAPRQPEDADENRLETFKLLDTRLAELDMLAGRLAMETGQFWRREERVNRKDSVDSRLLRDISGLEHALVDEMGLGRDDAQSLVGRSIFTKYLIDRRIVTAQRLMRLCGHRDLPRVLRDRSATKCLFDWLRKTFNGDMFPPAPKSVPAARHLERVARFLEAEDPETGQMSLFPYRFEFIPVELISAIYEQFVHSAAAEASGETPAPAKSEGAYYTPLAAVSLVLDEVFDGLTGHEQVLDLTCGSGVFLVEALRRLVYLKSEGSKPSRKMIRETLYKQLCGVDVSRAAVRIAAFSLYLAALELDPDPQPPHALRFEPLEGRTLLVGDVRGIEHTPGGRKAFTTTKGLKRFDVIVGNPPWSFKGKAGTAVRRAAVSHVPLQPRGQSLDFVARAMDFAHDKTRVGMILSATPFFSRSSTGVEAAHGVVEALAPVTLVNLSDLSGWLFPKANMPAIALLARHREQPVNRVTLMQASWSLASERTHTLEIAPSNITTLPIASWKRNQGLFKAAFLGRRHDLLLLDDLWEKYETLEVRLDALNTRLSNGLTVGKPDNRNNDATFLKNLPFAKRSRGDRYMRHFFVSDNLPGFEHDKVQWPRKRETYRAPLLLVGEFMEGGPRPVTAVAGRDVVYTDAYNGVSFSRNAPETAYLVSGVLSSALASWYFLMTGSTFGLWIQRLKLRDIAAMPMPELNEAVESDAGKRVVQLVRTFHRKAPDDDDWESLDNCVFDLYGLDKTDRIVVQDGLFRASWQWKQGRLESIAPANSDKLRNYAHAFLSTMDGWLSASNRRRMRAEIYDVERDAPLRAIRFVLEDVPGPSVIEIVSPDGTLSQVLARIGDRTKVQITDALVGMRELRVHTRDEVSIIKPAARRHWLGVCGLEDADAVVKDSVYGRHTT